MSFRQNASPLSRGRSTQAIDFARRASNRLLPWIREHYQIHALNPASWGANGGAAGLYNYHLRGDYYLGLTKTAAAGLENLNLGSMPPPAIEAPPRLVHVAEAPRAFTGVESNQLVDALIGNGVAYNNRLPDYGAVPNYGVLGASDTLVGGPHASHFFAREVANGSMLTEFLFAEQATMTYRLLPYMDNLSTQVRNFLLDEALHFINNIDRLQSPTGNNPHGIHPAFDLTDINNPLNSIMARLDGLGLPGFSIADLGVINMPDGMANINPSTSSPTFTGLIGTVGAEIPIFTLPIYYALTAYKEYEELIEPNLDAALQGQLDEVFARLFLSAVRVSYRIGGYMRETAVLALGFPSVLDFTPRFFQSQARAGGTIFRCIKNNNYREGPVRNELQTFFDTYFEALAGGFPPGTIVTLNIDSVEANGTRTFFQQAVNNQVENRNGRAPGAPAAGFPAGNPNRLDTNQIDAFFDMHGTRFMITGDTGRVSGSNSPRTFSMISVQDDGTPSAEVLELRRMPEHRNVSGVNIPGFTVFRNANQGSTDPRKHSPMNIIGRLLLSASYSIFNAGSYLNTRRDMRKLTNQDSPGHFPPLNEAIRTGAVRHGQVGHEAGNNLGVIDLYAEQRADLINDYLAAMYDSLKGKYRDDFVRFYDGDFHTNELSFYTAAVSNYISSEVAPEDANRDAVLVGPRLATRLPQDPSGFLPDYRQIQHFRNADPELIYYQIDSPLLREVLRQLNVEFYTWYTTLAEGLDRGIRNTTRAGNEERDEFTPGTNTIIPTGIIRTARGSRQDPARDRQRIRPTKAILEAMWPLLNTRATNAVESSAVPAHTMLRTLALAVNRHRANTSNAVPAVPISMSFVNFGQLLRSPGQYALPPSTSSKDVSAFIDYLQATYYNDYAIIAELAGNIETVKTEGMTQDQLIATFERLYNSYRNTTALNRFKFPATATLVNIFRELIAVPGIARAAIAAADAGTTTTAQPPAPYDQPAAAPPIPEPMRRA